MRATRGGRPRIEIALGDPDLSAKARALRAQGMSWSRIAASLGVGRTTARRLCQNRRDGAGSQVEVVPASGSLQNHTPFLNGAGTIPEPAEGEPEGDASEDALPESFRLFRTLLRRAGDDATKAKGT